MLKEIQSLIKSLRKKSKKLYRSGFQAAQQPQLLIADSGTNVNTVIQRNSTPNIVQDDKRLEEKPIEIYKEIISEKPIMNLANLDEQIKIVKRRKEVMERN
jgi:hypothetical protein